MADPIEPVTTKDLQEKIIQQIDSVRKAEKAKFAEQAERARESRAAELEELRQGFFKPVKLVRDSSGVTDERRGGMVDSSG